MQWDYTIHTVYYYLLFIIKSTEGLEDCNIVDEKNYLSHEMYNLSLNRTLNHNNDYNLKSLDNLTDRPCLLLACVINSSVASSCSNSECSNCKLIEFDCSSSFCGDDGDGNNQPSAAST